MVEKYIYSIYLKSETKNKYSVASKIKRIK